MAIIAKFTDLKTGLVNENSYIKLSALNLSTGSGSARFIVFSSKAARLANLVNLSPIDIDFSSSDLNAENIYYAAFQALKAKDFLEDIEDDL